THLLTEDEAWEAFILKANLPREEEAALRETLKKLTALLAIKDKDRLRKDQKSRKRFLEAFPQLKVKVEEHIRKLHALADHIEAMHSGCTISNMVADSFSAASNVMEILGLFLAPVSAESSLVLSAAGLGLGIAATVSSVAASIVEETSRFGDEVKASHQASTSMNLMKETRPTKIADKLLQATQDIIQDLEALEQHMEALKLVRTNPRLEEDARILATTGRLPAQRARQVQNSLRGTSLAMTREARLSSATTAGVSLWKDMASLMKESDHLYEGARSESAEARRKLAQELEEKLEMLTKFYKSK
uniref:Apolipoprotein L3-like n=2 Tax=Nannospalax galili TaxID=1026970 RepID=A0A8C6QGT6_NANGA